MIPYFVPTCVLGGNGKTHSRRRRSIFSCAFGQGVRRTAEIRWALVATRWYRRTLYKEDAWSFSSTPARAAVTTLWIVSTTTLGSS